MKELKKILVIDDEPDVLELVSARLSANGYQVLTANAGVLGLEKAFKEKPQLIILDLGLADIEGQEVCRKIKMSINYRNIPVMMLTMQNVDEALVESLEAGADGYVNKNQPLEVIVRRAEALIKLSVAAGPLLEAAGGDENEEINLKDKKVLLVDDDVTYLYGLKRALTEEGYQVTPCLSAEECLN